MSNSTLAQEVLVEIFLRLDTKALVKCISVCKTWKSLITDPSFISIHLNQNQKLFHNVGPQLLLLYHCYQSSSEFFSRNPGTRPSMMFSLRFDDDQLGFFSRLYPPDIVHNDAYLRVVGTCNGLICLADNLSSFPFNLIVWNPCVRRYLRLPQPNIPSSANRFAVIGFGFDCKTNDFKVVRIYNNHLGSVDSTLAEVYSLSLGCSWKNVSDIIPYCMLQRNIRSHQVLVNGVIHWIQRRQRDRHVFNFILCFHLADEVFQEILLPGSLTTSDYNDIVLLRSGESIALVERSEHPPVINVWVMQKYGIVDSWGIIFSLSSEDFSSEDEDSEDENGGQGRVLAIRKGSELIIELDGLHSVRKGEIIDLNVEGNGNIFVDYYVESLFLLNNVKYAKPYSVVGDMDEKLKRGIRRMELKECSEGHSNFTVWQKSRSL